MAMQISRIYRLLRLITLLQSGRSYSPDELAAELEVSRRTVFRDLNVLEMARIPYYFDPDRNGYRINGNFFLPPINLDLTEALSILVMARRVRSSQSVPLLAQASRAAMKIESALPAYVRRHVGSVIEHFAMKIGPVAEQGGADGHFDQIVDAIARKRICRLQYNSFHEGQVIGLKLHPYKLAFLQRAWYVVGFSQMHDEVRTFKLARIQRMSVTTEAFADGDGFDLDAHFGSAWNMIPEGTLYDVHLRFASRVAGNVAEVLWHPTQRIEPRDDGAIDFHARVDGLGEIHWWILGYGQHVEVLAPAALRERVASTAAELCALYGRQDGAAAPR